MLVCLKILFLRGGLPRDSFPPVLWEGREQHWSELCQGLLLVATLSSGSQPCHLPCFADATQLLLAKTCKDTYVLA